MCLLTLLTHPSWTLCGQPKETLIFGVSMLVGELFGFVCNQALRTMFIAQARAQKLQVFYGPPTRDVPSRVSPPLADFLTSHFDPQAHRVEQLECEKQRIEFDLRFSERRLAASLETMSSSANRATQGRPSSQGGSSWDGLPSHIAAGLVADGLIRNDETAAPTGESRIFRLEGGRTLEPVSHLSNCGASTVGSDSEVGAILELDEEAHAQPGSASMRTRR